MDGVLYLTGRDIAALGVPPGRLRAALARAFRLHAEGRTHVEPKLTVAIAPGHFFQSLCAASPDLSFAATKWVGVAAENAARGLAGVNGLVILSDFATGVPAAILDGNVLTVVRTAAMSALAAEYLARQDGESIGFIGCGAQAHGHLAALRETLPRLRRVVCYSRGSASAEGLREAAGAQGLDAQIARTPDEALACDVVVTSVPAGAAPAPFLDAGSLRPGTFVSAVDLGRSWRGETLRAFDIVATDDRVQAMDLVDESAARLRRTLRLRSGLARQRRRRRPQRSGAAHPVRLSRVCPRGPCRRGRNLRRRRGSRARHASAALEQALRSRPALIAASASPYWSIRWRRYRAHEPQGGGPVAALPCSRRRSARPASR